MNISSVSATNFKGRSFTHELAPLTVVTGPNSTGKSSVLEAVALAALGYMPTDGAPVKADRDLFDTYASGDCMSVGVVLSDGRRVDRSWRLVGGSVKYSGPNDPLLQPLSLDHMAYLGLSGPQRRAMLFKIAAGSGALPDTAGLMARVSAAVKEHKFERNTEATEKALSQVVADLAAKKPDGEDWLAWLEATVEGVKELKAQALQSARRQRQTVQGLAQEAAVRQPVAPGAESRLKDSKVLLEAAVKAQAVADERLKACRDSYRTAAERAKAAKPVAQAAADEAQLAALLAEPKFEAPSLEGLGQRKQEAEDAWARAHELSCSASRTHHEAVAALEPKCPTCGCTPKRTARQFRALAKRCEQAQKDAEAAAAAAGAAKVAVKDAAERLATCTSLVQDKADKVTRIAELAARLEAQRVAVLAATEVESLKQQGAQLGEQATAAATATATLRQRVSEADAERRVELAAASADSSAAKAADAADEYEARHQALGVACDKLAKEQQRLTDAAIGPAVAQVNRVVAGQLPSEVVFDGGEFKLACGWGRRSASDSEKLLLNAGVAVALGQASGFRLAVVPRFESLDQARRQWMLKRVLELLAGGQLDQCLVVEVDGAPTNGYVNTLAHAGNLKVITLTKGTRQ